jgi:hypothetical protein
MCFEDPEVSAEKLKNILVKSLDTRIGAYNISQFLLTFLILWIFVLSH